FVDDDDAIPRSSRLQGRGEAGTPAADNQNVAVRMHLVEASGVRFRGNPSFAVQAHSLKAIDQFDLRRAKHRLGADLHQGIWFFNAGGEDAAWPAGRDTASDYLNIVRQQGGSERVAGVAAVRPAVEGE